MYYLHSKMQRNPLVRVLSVHISKHPELIYVWINALIELDSRQ